MLSLLKKNDPRYGKVEAAFQAIWKAEKAELIKEDTDKRGFRAYIMNQNQEGELRSLGLCFVSYKEVDQVDAGTWIDKTPKAPGKKDKVIVRKKKEKGHGEEK